MGLLENLFTVFIFLFSAGELLRLQFSNGTAISINDIYLFIIVTCWVFLKRRKLHVNYFLFKPIVLFVGIGLISLFLNLVNLKIYFFAISFLYLLRFLGYAALYFIVKDFSLKYKNKLGKYLLFSGLIFLLLGYAQYIFYPSLKSLYGQGWDEHLYRMFGTFLDPNFAGAFYSIYFIYSVDYLRKLYKGKFNRNIFFLFLLSLFSLIAVYLTYSRSALIMLFISVFTYLILLKKIKYLLITAIFLTLMVFISPRAFQTEGTNLFRTVSSTERIKSYDVAFRIIQTSPIYGVGFNAYRYAQNKIGLNDKNWQITHAGAGNDNSFLFIIATTGFVGFIAYLYLLYKMFSSAKRGFKGYGLILFSVTIGLMFESFFVNSLFFVFILEWVWILAGLTESS